MTPGHNCSKSGSSSPTTSTAIGLSIIHVLAPISILLTSPIDTGSQTNRADTPGRKGVLKTEEEQVDVQMRGEEADDE